MAVRRKKINVFHLFARFGCVSNGIVYSMVGTIALLSLLRLKDGGADEGSIMEFLKIVPAGKIVLWVILGGMFCYVMWRIYEAITDPYRYGIDRKGISKRIGIALSSIADGLIGFAALQVLMGIQEAALNGAPIAQRSMLSKLFDWRGGEWIAGTVGFITCFTACAQFIYVIGKDYEDRLQMKGMARLIRKIIQALAWAGHFARGIIILIIGFFLIKSAVLSDPQQSLNTDKAFNFLGEQVNHPVYVLVAAGTICYGLFMFAMAVYYDYD